jgi:hypothetical protein
MGLELLILAATTDGPTTIEGVFVSYGLIGVVALVLGSFAVSTIKDLRERAKRLETTTDASTRSWPGSSCRP